MKVLLPAGCGDPTALVAEILLQSDRLAPLTLMAVSASTTIPSERPA
jgi:hypothetical protein